MNRSINNPLSHWQIILVLSVCILLAIFMETIFKLSAEVSRIIQISGTAICCIFIGDFFFRIFPSQNRLSFLKWGLDRPDFQHSGSANVSVGKNDPTVIPGSTEY